MGTRHLIFIFLGGKMVLAQYGQWDGDAAGFHILKWLHVSENLDTLKEKLRNNVLFTPSEPQLNEYQAEINKEEDKMEQMRREGIIISGDAIDRVVPSLSRNTSYKILDIIVKSKEPVPVQLGDADFVFDGICEWAYVLDMDEDVFEVYAGLTKTSLSGRSSRFDFMHDESDTTRWSPHLVRSYGFAALPPVSDYLR